MYRIDTSKLDRELEKQTKRKEYLERKIHKEVSEFMGIQVPKGGFSKCSTFTTADKTVREILESGMEFNINSAVTMKEVMFNIMGIPIHDMVMKRPKLSASVVRGYALARNKDGTRLYPIMWRYYQYKRCSVLINKLLIPLKKKRSKEV